MTREEIQRFLDEAVGSRPEAIYEALDALATAAYATGAHVEEAWQDRRTAKVWVKIGKLIETTEMKVKKMVPF